MNRSRKKLKKEQGREEEKGEKEKNIEKTLLEIPGSEN